MADPEGTSILEWSQPGDLYRDYCLWEFQPAASTTGKLRSATLLWHSLVACGAPDRLRQMIQALRAALGPFRTVWGVKQAAGQITWELYFYDYARLERHVSVERVLDVLRPFARSQLRISAARPYFMFSLDLDDALGRCERPIDQLSVYLGNPSAGVSSGICYNLSAEGLRLDNLYYFFDARTDWNSAVAKIACSAHLDLAALRLEDLLWPELRDCGFVVVANKRFCDGVYFSRIGVDALIYFVERMAYPAGMVSFLKQHRSRLDHLLFDVGLDYQLRGNRLDFTKSAFYGTV